MYLTLVGGEPLFTQKTYDVHQATLKHINAGLFFDPADVDCPLYAEKTKLKNGLSVWRCARGTSQLEVGTVSRILTRHSVYEYLCSYNTSCATLHISAGGGQTGMARSAVRSRFLSLRHTIITLPNS